MIKKHSDDPDVEAAAHQALDIVRATLADMPGAESFDYGGHILKIGEYDVCPRCTVPIAEAQQAYKVLAEKAEHIDDETIAEHVQLAAELFRLEAEAAQIRAEFHNGHGSEKILNEVLGFLYQRNVHDSYDHSHNQGK
jgi:hypothetical protein